MPSSLERLHHRGETRLAPLASVLTVMTAAAACLLTASVTAAKAPGQSHCYGDVCHRVLTLAETRAELGKLRRIVASHYDDCSKDRFNPCGLTSSGEVFRPHAPDNTASSIHPDGTILLLRNPASGQSAVVRVNNFGPFKGNRKLDVSRATAERLGFASRGVAALDAMVVHAPTAEETRYKSHRRYAPVPGALGRTASIEQAYLAYTDKIDGLAKTRLAEAKESEAKRAAEAEAQRVTRTAASKEKAARHLAAAEAQKALQVALAEANAARLAAAAETHETVRLAAIREQAARQRAAEVPVTPHLVAAGVSRPAVATAMSAGASPEAAIAGHAHLSVAERRQLLRFATAACRITARQRIPRLQLIALAGAARRSAEVVLPTALVRARTQGKAATPFPGAAGAARKAVVLPAPSPIARPATPRLAARG